MRHVNLRSSHSRTLEIEIAISVSIGRGIVKTARNSGFCEAVWWTVYYSMYPILIFLCDACHCHIWSKTKYSYILIKPVEIIYSVMLIVLFLWVRPTGLFQLRINFRNFESFLDIGKIPCVGDRTIRRPLPIQGNTDTRTRTQPTSRVEFDSNQRSQYSSSLRHTRISHRAWSAYWAVFMELILTISGSKTMYKRVICFM
jgi:hypothetical protein